MIIVKIKISNYKLSNPNCFILGILAKPTFVLVLIVARETRGRCLWDKNHLLFWSEVVDLFSPLAGSLALTHNRLELFDLRNSRTNFALAFYREIVVLCFAIRHGDAPALRHRNDHVFSLVRGRTRSWLFGRTRFSRIPVFLFLSPLIWLDSIHSFRTQALRGRETWKLSSHVLQDLSFFEFSNLGLSFHLYYLSILSYYPVQEFRL